MDLAKLKNEGTVDRAVRAVAGIALIGWAVAGGPVWAWIGILPLATAVVGWCPAYSVLGIRSCPSK